jgi:hypothetical protein
MTDMEKIKLSILNAFTRRDGHTAPDTTNMVDGLMAVAAALNRLADLVEKENEE